MAHQQQIDFCLSVKKRFPDHFKGKKVLDCGSLDINGNNRYLFEYCQYIGIDITAGKNVDRIESVHEHYFNNEHVELWYDTIISTEMLEHDKFYIQSLMSMVEMLSPGGLLLITAAGEGRKEHGTTKRSPGDSPATNDYYRNITNEMFLSVLPADLFKESFIRQYKRDFQFCGIKK